MATSGHTLSAPLPEPQSNQPTRPPLSPTGPTGSSSAGQPMSAPLAAWLLLQAVALLLAATRIPLYAHYLRASERLAVYLLLAAQIGGSAVLFPWLLGSGRAAVAVVATAWPFLAVAAAFS